MTGREKAREAARKKKEREAKEREAKERERVSAQTSKASQAHGEPTANSEKSTNNDDPAARAEVDEMQRKAPLLKLIESDLGEGKGTDTIKWSEGQCPICGHDVGGFTFYRATNTWACYNGSNENAKQTNRIPSETGGYIEYQRRVHGMTATEAMKALREATNHPYDQRAGRVEGTNNASASGQKADTLRLPPISPVPAKEPPKRSPSLIDGVLRLGHVGQISGKAKSGKSWMLIALCCSVATGLPWVGFTVRRGRVLYVDPELDPRSMVGRFHDVAEAMDADLAEVEANVDRLSLRGVTLGDGRAANIGDVAHDLALMREAGTLHDYSLIAIDSCSALLGDRDENKSGDVRAYFNVTLRIARTTGAAVVVVAHEGKAMSGDREAQDRARGSSVWTDAPDVVMSLVRVHPPQGEDGDHLAEGQRAYALECAAIREFPTFDLKRLIWQWPTFTVDADGVTEGWKPTSSQGKGGKESAKVREAQAERDAMMVQAAILAHLYTNGITDADGLTTTDAARVAGEALGKKTIQTKTLRKHLEGSPYLCIWEKSTRKHYVCPLHRAPSSEGQAGTSQTSMEV